MLLNEDNLKMIIDICDINKQGLHASLTEFQRQVMENNFHVSIKYSNSVSDTSYITALLMLQSHVFVSQLSVLLLILFQYID